MAGYAYGLDEGGAIPDDEQGAPPIESDADSGETSPGFTPPQEDTSGATPPANAKRIIQYLMGAGAAHPDVADKFSTAVKMEHPGTSDDDANLISILKAKQKGGDEAASALLQSHMQQYAAKNAFAHAALSGGAAGQGQQPEQAQQPAQEQGLPDVGERPINLLGQKLKHDIGEGWENFKHSGPVNLVKRAINTPGDPQAAQNKGPDPHAAAEAATLASQHMLDGSHTKFVANPDGGFTAAVKDAKNVHQSFDLTPQQFAEWTRPGGAGQWDQVLATGGVAPALAKLTSASQDNGQSDDQGSAGQSAGHEELRYQPPQAGNAKAAPAQSDDDADEAKENAKLDAQSRKIFPWISQEQQRQAWIAQQQSANAKLQNNIDVKKAEGTFRVLSEGEKNKGRLGAATIRGNAQVEAAKQRAIADVARQAAISGREDDRRRAKIFTTLVNSSNIASQADIDKAAKAAGITLGGAFMQPMGGAQPTQSPTQPAQGTAPAAGKRSFTASNVPPAEQRQVGDTIQTSKGSFQWTGNGWQTQ